MIGQFLQKLRLLESQCIDYVLALQQKPPGTERNNDYPEYHQQVPVPGKVLLRYVAAARVSEKWDEPASRDCTCQEPCIGTSHSYNFLPDSGRIDEYTFASQSRNVNRR